MSQKKTYKDIYQSLPEQLAAHYPDLNFENHCYLRIALDNTLQAKWDTKISRPAYKHLTEKQIISVREFLQAYLNNRALLLRHNENSLLWRKK